MSHLYLKIASLLFISSFVLSQDTLSLETIEVPVEKKGFKKLNLYDGDIDEDFNVRGFTQLSIFQESLSDFWTTESKKCIRTRLLEFNGSNILNINWNKDQLGCDWVGMGFGWDGWTGKDMGYVYDTLALELTVRSTNENFTNIPWAFCFEDYSGRQAWLGYNKSFLETKYITKKWSIVKIPLALFPFENDDVDLSNIKQLLIQVFSEGEIEIKSINLVPFSGKLKKEANAKKVSTIRIDGDLKEWDNNFYKIGDHSFSASYNEDSLFFAFKIKDSTPRENSQIGSALWNGDAIEIAFSTNMKANSKRNFLLLSDQHIGINCGPSPYFWNWKTNEKINLTNFKIKNLTNGYIVEFALPYSTFRDFSPKQGNKFDFEVAIDCGEQNLRLKQERWNSEDTEGFHQSPSLWGEINFK